MELPVAIASLLRRLRRRWFARRSLRRGFRALTLALALLLAGSVVSDILLSGLPFRIVVLAAASLAFVAGGLSALVRRPEDLALVRIVDDADTLSSALAFVRAADSSPFARLTIDRAARLASTWDARSCLPLRIARRDLVPALLLTCVSAAWMIWSPIDHWRTRLGRGPVQVPQALLTAAAQEAKQLAADAQGRSPVAAAAAQRLQALIEKMQTAPPSADEALTRLAAIEGVLDQAGDQTWLDRATGALRDAGKALRGAALTEEPGRHLEHGQTPEAAKALRNAADKARQQSTSRPAGASSEESKEAARRLQRASDALRGVAPDLARDLADAARDLDDDDPKSAADQLGRSAADLDELHRQLEQMKTLKRADLQVARLKDAIRGGLPPESDPRWAILMAEVPETLRRMALPTVRTNGASDGPSGIGTADTGSGAGGRQTHLDATRTPVQVPGRPGEKGPTIQRVVRTAAGADTTTIDLRTVYAQYQAQAEAALSFESVPLGYRFYVRRYFEGIRPESGQQSAISGQH